MQLSRVLIPTVDKNRHDITIHGIFLSPKCYGVRQPRSWDETRTRRFATVNVGGYFNMDIHMGHFRDKGEEIECLQQAVRQLQSELDDSKQLIWQLNSESEEFRESSWQLEKELENSLEQAEKKNHDLKHLCNKLEKETDDLKGKIDEIKRVNDSLNSDLLKYKQLETEWITRIRRLEQQNDDLERALRVARDCTTTAEQHLDEALEKEVLREGEKEDLVILLQQLREENRDLTEEIRIRDKLTASMEKSLEESGESRMSVETQTQAVQPFKNKVSRALHRTRALGRSLNCMARGNV